jgi:hypothetical protein
MRSTQKFPRVRAELREIDRTRAAAMPMPTAAEVKLCRVSPTIWEKYERVDSPP